MSVRIHQCEWPAGDLAARVASADAVVCAASLLAFGEDVDGCLEVLVGDERTRVTNCTNDIVGRRYAAGRRLLREILGAALGMAPREVPLLDGVHGKPLLGTGARARLWFSVAHTDELLLVAMSRSADIGVDVERVRAFEQWQRVADRVLSAQERRQLDLAVEQGEDPGEAFLRHWCRVEAELKAIGCGIQGLDAHRAGVAPRGLRLADLPKLPLPAAVVASGARYQAAVALCTPDSRWPVEPERALQRRSDAAQAATPVTSPASASTP